MFSWGGNSTGQGQVPQRQMAPQTHAQLPAAQAGQAAQAQAVAVQHAQVQANYQAQSRAMSQAQGQMQVPAGTAMTPAQMLAEHAFRTAGAPIALPPMVKPAAASGPRYMPLNLYYPGLQKVCSQPPVYIVDNFLTDEECDHLIETAKPLLQRSKTHAIAGDSARPARTPR